MAKNNRGGLGRGLNSLINGPSSTPRTTERERIIYNENEEIDYSDQDAKLSGKTDNFERVAVEKTAPKQIPSEPRAIPRQEEESAPQSSNLINASINQAPKPVEKSVSREKHKPTEYPKQE